MSIVHWDYATPCWMEFLPEINQEWLYARTAYTPEAFYLKGKAEPTQRILMRFLSTSSAFLLQGMERSANWFGSRSIYSLYVLGSGLTPCQNSSQPVLCYFIHASFARHWDANLTTGLAGGNSGRWTKNAWAIGAPHACEIEYAMGKSFTSRRFLLGPGRYKVSKTFMVFFANFIKTGNPNGEKSPDGANWREMTNPPVMEYQYWAKCFRSWRIPLPALTNFMIASTETIKDKCLINLTPSKKKESWKLPFFWFQPQRKRDPHGIPQKQMLRIAGQAQLNAQVQKDNPRMNASHIIHVLTEIPCDLCVSNFLF